MRNVATLVLAALLAVAGSQNALGGQTSSSAQSSASSAAGLAPLNLPKGTVFLAKLSTDLASRQCKKGDPVEAEAKQDVKQGHDVLLKKGSMLLGHVAALESSASDKQLTVGIAFDSVRMKDGKQFSLLLIIQALAPEADITNNSSLSGGRGLDATAQTAAVKHGDSTLRGTINQLDTKSTGVYDMPGIELSEQITNEGRYSLLASSGDFKLKKGAQLVMEVVAP